MKEIRNLLLDCRAALRKGDPRFEDSPLGRRLDASILEVGRAAEQRQVQATQAQAPAVVPDKPVAQRVAYAWQGAARELRQTHPELYQRLWEKVLALLDVGVLEDPASEIAALQEKLAAGERALASANTELAALHATPAAATPAGSPAAGMAASTQPGPSGFPSRAELEAVVAGTRAFGKDELECCIGEALVRTGFQRTPVQLLEDGEAGLARLLLESTP